LSKQSIADVEERNKAAKYIQVMGSLNSSARRIGFST
jgi:hypothetical protein